MLQNTQFQSSNSSSTTIRTNPQNIAIYAHSLQIHQQYRQIYQIYIRTIQSFLLQYLSLQCHNQLTETLLHQSLNLSKPFDGLGHNYTPKFTTN